MIDEWRQVPLGEVVNLKRGYDLPKRLRRDGAFPVISSSGLTGKHSEFKVQPPSVVTGRYGTLGQVYYVESPMWPLNTTLYVEDFKGNVPRFVAYLLESLKLDQLVASAAVPGINRNHLHPLPVRIPEVAVQSRIASALGSLDDLIDSSRRRIEILEEMTRLLYLEWFVQFRFPGHDNARFVDSDLGPVPQGWQAGEFADLVSEVRRSVPPEDIPADAPVVGLEHLPRRSTTLLSWQSASTVGSRRKEFEEGDILFAKIRPYFHKVIDAPFMGYASTDAIVFRPRSAETCARALAVASSDEFIDVATATSNGTRMPRADTEVLMSYAVLHPTSSVEQAFNEAVGPMDRLRKTLARQSRCLREARDLLLPRLVSGELAVSDLDLELEVAGV